MSTILVLYSDICAVMVAGCCHTVGPVPYSVVINWNIHLNANCHHRLLFPQSTRQVMEKAIEIRSQCKHFRILIIGRSNAGKTTILKKVCNSIKEPMIFSQSGEKVRGILFCVKLILIISRLSRIRSRYCRRVGVGENFYPRSSEQL